MSDKEILETAIQKAINGGWSNEYWVKRFNLAKELDEFEHLFNNETPSVESVIFNHDFANAIAGDEFEDLLVTAVLSKDPVRTLAKWL